MTGEQRALWSLRTQISSLLWGEISRAGVSVLELASLAGVSEHRLNNILNSRGRPVLLTELADLAWCLNTRWRFNFGDEGIR